MHMAVGMIRRKQNIPMANYIQNVCSIMSVNCLLDLTLLPYFENIFACFLYVSVFFVFSSKIDYFTEPQCQDNEIALRLAKRLTFATYIKTAIRQNRPYRVKDRRYNIEINKKIKLYSLGLWQKCR